MVQNLIGSLHHPFVVAVRGMVRSTVICDAEHGNVLETVKPAGAAAFTPDGVSLVTGMEGLTTWDFRPLMQRRERILTGEASQLDRMCLPILVGKALVGDQVSPFPSPDNTMLILGFHTTVPH